ncbi:MAG: 50S ribosomal protein L35 [Candidatus Magasanikbacteria bacterium]|nr:50S ribosomal protein L35 [Candidatus Magasanikbacteria bacterium]
MKQKTNQAIAKRFKVTRTGKILKRVSGQAHFNSRESGKVGRNKRRDVTASRTIRYTIETALPRY